MRTARKNVPRRVGPASREEMASEHLDHIRTNPKPPRSDKTEFGKQKGPISMGSRKSELTARGKKVTRVAKRLQREKLTKKKKFQLATKHPSISATLKRAIYLESGRKCHLCGRRISVIGNCQIDHVRPRAIGGKDVTTNYLPICKSCNSLKRNSTPRQIRQAIRIGMWALTQIRNSTTVGIEIANKYNKDLE